MADLFEKDTDTISLHLKNIYQEGELDESSTTEEYSVVQPEGKRKVKRHLKHYNLDAIISVGYRVNSKRGTQFRIWATKRLKDYLVQGYAINEKRLAQKEMQVQHLKTGIQILGRAIEQKAGEQDVYPTLEEKAAMLLYLITKNHAFADGNKRIAAACFLLFLKTNNLLKNAKGEQIISNEALASLTLFVAASKPEEKETVKRLLISVLNRNQ